MEDLAQVRQWATVDGAAPGLPLLGYTVSWRFSGIEIGHDDLRRRLLAAGFGAYTPPPPTARATLRRALIAWIRERSRAGRGPSLAWDGAELDDGGAARQRALIRTINRRDSDWLVFVLVAEDVDLIALGLSYGTSLRFLLHKSSGRLVCTTDATGEADAVLESAQIEAEVQPHWQHHRELHVSGDLALVVRRIVGGLGAVALREGGGYYFLPERQREPLIRLRRFVAALPVRPGHEPFLLALPQPDVQAARRQLAQAAHAGFMDELAAMDGDLQRFLDADPGSVRQSTMARRLAEFKAFRTKADAYADLLGMRQERIAAALNALVAKARAVVLKGTESPDDAGFGDEILPIAGDIPPAEAGLLPFAEAARQRSA